MRIFPIIAAAMTVLAGAAQAQPSQKTGSGDTLIAAQWETAELAAQRGDAGMIMDALQTAMSDEVYGQLSAGKQYEVAKLYARAAGRLSRWDIAHHAMVLVSENPHAADEDWAARLSDAVFTGDGADAWLVFRRLIDRHQPPLQFLDGRQLERFDTALATLPDAREARLALGREMEKEAWRAPTIFNDDSIVWLHYAEALLDKGDRARAATVAGRIGDPVVIMAMKADLRFDALIAANPRLGDPAAAANAYLRWARDYARENPQVMGGRIALIRALSVVGKVDEAHDVAEATALAMAHGSQDAPAFYDMGDTQFFEAWNDRVLVNLGRSGEAIGGLAAEASCNCSVWANVELGRLLVDAGRSKEAQRWLTGVNEEALGLEDRMTLSQTRACAAAQLDDQASFGRELGFLRAHEAWAPQAVVQALLCANRMDEAATTVTRQLDNPGDRLAALGALQTYPAEPGAPAFASILQQRWAKLAALPAVQAEVAKVGRINAFDLRPLEPIA